MFLYIHISLLDIYHSPITDHQNQPSSYQIINLKIKANHQRNVNYNFDVISELSIGISLIDYRASRNFPSRDANWRDWSLHETRDFLLFWKISAIKPGIFSNFRDFLKNIRKSRDFVVLRFFFLTIFIMRTLSHFPNYYSHKRCYSVFYHCSFKLYFSESNIQVKILQTIILKSKNFQLKSQFQGFFF